MILSTFDLQPAMLSILIVWVALAAERMLTIKDSIDPLIFFRFLCERMAQRVLKTNYTDQQAYISGALGLCVLITPIIVITFLIREFAGYQWLLDILLLWVLLQYNRHVKIIKKSMQALANGKKQLSKSLLQQTVLRKTDNLSELGMVKSSLETAFLRYSHQYITVIFWFIVAGPIAALLYRLCYEANQVWSPKLPAYTKFATLSKVITQLFQFLPSLLCAVSFMLINHPQNAINSIMSKQFWELLFSSQRLLLLRSLAFAMQVGTSGPVIYGANKVRFPRFSAKQNAQYEAKIEDLNNLISKSNKHLILCLIVVTWTVFWLTQ